MIFSGLKLIWCEGRDSNPRTPTRLGPQPSAFGLAGQPSHAVVFRHKWANGIYTLPIWMATNLPIMDFCFCY